MGKYYSKSYQSPFQALSDIPEAEWTEVADEAPKALPAPRTALEVAGDRLRLVLQEGVRD